MEDNAEGEEQVCHPIGVKIGSLVMGSRLKEVVKAAMCGVVEGDEAMMRDGRNTFTMQWLLVTSK